MKPPSTFVFTRKGCRRDTASDLLALTRRVLSCGHAGILATLLEELRAIAERPDTGVHGYRAAFTMDSSEPCAEQTSTQPSAAPLPSLD